MSDHSSVILLLSPRTVAEQESKEKRLGVHAER